MADIVTQPSPLLGMALNLATWAATGRPVSTAATQLDIERMVIARALFTADAIFQGVPEPDFSTAELPVRQHYLDAAEQAIVLASDYLRSEARQRTIDATKARIDADDDPLLEGDLFLAQTAAEIATAEYPRQLQVAYRAERSRR